MKNLWNEYSYALILIVLTCLITIMISIHSKSNDVFLKVTVSEGDSIWKISEQFSDQHTLSNTEFVSWVKQHNNIEGEKIFPGEKIMIPVNKTAPSPIEFASGAGK
ncbi:MAG TPA: LysM peptidoglycan-binding domain-containing protein [Neobacillus sp.]